MAGFEIYEGWKIARWTTPVVDIDDLLLVSLTDAERQLTMVFEAARTSGRPRWRVRFEGYPAYRNIDESGRLGLWRWLDESGQRCGHTFTVLDSPWASSCGDGYLLGMNPMLRHFVICTDDDVIEVLADAEPVWELADAARPEDPAVGKSEHFFLPEDRARVEQLIKETQDRQPSNLVEGSDKLERIIGRWPDFHDAEVLSITLDRAPADIGPTVRIAVHAFEMTKDVDASGHYSLRNHVVVTFVLHAAEVLRLEGFNHQNVLDGISFSRPQKPVTESMAVEIELQSSFGVSAIFQCARVEVVSVEPFDPAKGTR